MENFWCAIRNTCNICLQVSGRSNLSWDDSVRLDLYYVENWSLTMDLAIIAKTAKAVLAGSGAY